MAVHVACGGCATLPPNNNRIDSPSQWPWPEKSTNQVKYYPRYSTLFLTFAPTSKAVPIPLIVSNPAAYLLPLPPCSPRSLLRRSQSRLRSIGCRTPPLLSTGLPLRPTRVLLHRRVTRGATIAITATSHLPSCLFHGYRTQKLILPEFSSCLSFFFFFFFFVIQFYVLRSTLCYTFRRM